MNRRANEYLCILQEKFGDNLKITSTRGDTEWGSVNYDIAIYLETDILKQLSKNPTRTKEYKRDGIAACLDLDWIYIGDDIDDVIASMFNDLFNSGRLYDN